MDRKINSLNGLGIKKLMQLAMHVLRNIAPVSPEKTLEAIERAVNGAEGEAFVTRESSHSIEFVRLLRRFAYDPELFDRSVALLIRYALSEEKNENYNSIRDILKSLFYIYLSGTHASLEDRAKVIEKLVDSEDQDEQELGLFYSMPHWKHGILVRLTSSNLGRGPEIMGIIQIHEMK